MGQTAHAICMHPACIQDKNKEPAYGVEVLRLWVAHSHHHTNIMIGPSILTKFNEALFKVRNTLRTLNAVCQE